MTTHWKARYSRRNEWMSSSVIREILKLAQRPDIISLAGGWPDAALFPVSQFDEIVHDVLCHRAKEALQYGVTEGYKPLRALLARQMADFGIHASEDNIVVTSGSQQALDLIGRVLIDPGDVILVESPSYLGAIQAWRAYGAQFATVPLDEDGLCVDRLEEAIEEHEPKLLYVLPNFHNPAGVTLALRRRETLISVVDRYGIPLVEDDPYGQLRYEGDPLPPLIALDALRNNGSGNDYARGNTIYLSTFSKTLAPGLRLGWVVAPPDMARQIAMAKQGADLHTGTLSQLIAYEFCRRGLLPAQVQRICDTYRVRRDVMLGALERHFPDDVRWTKPQGGLFLWCALPDRADAVQLLKDTLETEKVAFVPGTAFYADGRGRNTLRLTFASSPPDLIEEGIKRLGNALRRHLS